MLFISKDVLEALVTVCQTLLCICSLTNANEHEAFHCYATRVQWMKIDAARHSILARTVANLA